MALAAADVALLVGTLFVVFAGRVVLVAAAVAVLVAVGGLRVSRVEGEVVLASICSCPRARKPCMGRCGEASA